MLMGVGVTLGGSRSSRLIGTQILFILYVSYGVNFVKCTYRMLFGGRESWRSEGEIQVVLEYCLSWHGQILSYL